MKKDELWAAYCARNPSFNNPDAQITMTGAGLKKLFEQTYDKAHDQGFKNGKAFTEMNAKTNNPFDELFGKMTGK